MADYLNIATKLLGSFKEWEVEHIPRSKNTRVDALSKLASSTSSFSGKMIVVEVLNSPLSIPMKQ